MVPGSSPSSGPEDSALLLRCQASPAQVTTQPSTSTTSTGATQPSPESPGSVVVWSAGGSGGIVVAAALATPPVRVFGVATVGGGVEDLGAVVERGEFEFVLFFGDL